MLKVEKRRVVTITLPETMNTAIDDVCDKLSKQAGARVSKSAFIEEAVREYFKLCYNTYKQKQNHGEAEGKDNSKNNTKIN